MYQKWSIRDRLTMSDRVNLTEAEMTSDLDPETGNRGRNSGNDDEQGGVKYSWYVKCAFQFFHLKIEFLNWFLS